MRWFLGLDSEGFAKMGIKIRNMSSSHAVKKKHDFPHIFPDIFSRSRLYFYTDHSISSISSVLFSLFQTAGRLDPHLLAEAMCVIRPRLRR